ncbi:MAG TPA: hypothetical protein VMU04_02900 [Candidatus Acidoferrum sp.]|nr:hypothetical protein [Candidatus Acidoferrum sp.]
MSVSLLPRHTQVLNELQKGLNASRSEIVQRFLELEQVCHYLTQELQRHAQAQTNPEVKA